MYASDLHTLPHNPALGFDIGEGSNITNLHKPIYVDKTLFGIMFILKWSSCSAMTCPKVQVLNKLVFMDPYKKFRLSNWGPYTCAIVLNRSISYRSTRSERAAGWALAKAMAGGQIERAQVVVCTKGGYLTFECDRPAYNLNPKQWIENTYFKRGIITTWADIVHGHHCIAPKFIRNQVSGPPFRSNMLQKMYLHVLCFSSLLWTGAQNLKQTLFRDVFSSCQLDWCLRVTLQ